MIKRVSVALSISVRARLVGLDPAAEGAAWVGLKQHGLTRLFCRVSQGHLRLLVSPFVRSCPFQLSLRYSALLKIAPGATDLAFTSLNLPNLFQSTLYLEDPSAHESQHNVHRLKSLLYLWVSIYAG